MSALIGGIITAVEGRESMLDKVLSKSEILKNLSGIARDENVAPNYRIKALELLGKAKGVFSDDEKIIGTVKIVDDIK